MKIVVFLVLLSAVILVQSIENTRISKQKCQEFNEISKKNNICNDSPVLDGTVQLKDYPFVGAIGYEGDEEWACSGTLISDQYVLTVAHCSITVAKRSKAKYVRFGETDLSSPNANAKTYEISEIILHPNYKAPIKYNDIALLKLDRPVNFTDYIRPACLYTGQDLPEYTVAGFSFRTKDFHSRPGILLHENNAVVSKENCSQVYEPQRKLPKGVDFDIQFCMAEDNIACEINSGAPVLHKEEELRCMQSIAGIVQLRKGLCHYSPGLNVKISGFIDWIESIAFS